MNRPDAAYLYSLESHLELPHRAQPEPELLRSHRGRRKDDAGVLEQVMQSIRSSWALSWEKEVPEHGERDVQSQVPVPKVGFGKRSFLDLRCTLKSERHPPRHNFKVLKPARDPMYVRGPAEPRLQTRPITSAPRVK